MGVMEKDGHVSTGIDSRGDVVGDELVAYSLDHTVTGMVVYHPLEGRRSRLLLSRRVTSNNRHDVSARSGKQSELLHTGPGPLPEAGATHERTLAAVACRPLFGRESL